MIGLTTALCELAPAAALGALDASERIRFEAHRDSCPECATGAFEGVVARLSAPVPAVAPDERLRDQLAVMADAPRGPIDPKGYDWFDVAPGIKAVVLKTDPERDLTVCLVWGQPGAVHPRHRHLGEEVILVLQGRIEDDDGSYGAGEILRSATGSIHVERAAPPDDCFCYVLYYGGIEELGPV